MWFHFTYLLVAIALVIADSLAGFYTGLKTPDRIDQAVFNRGLLALLAFIGLLLIVWTGTQGG